MKQQQRQKRKRKQIRSQRTSRKGPREEEEKRNSREQAGPVKRSGLGRRMTEPRLSTGQDQRRLQTRSKI